METKLTKAEQARINGAKSKGPKTKDGKRRSQQANLKHGLYAKAVPVGSLSIESDAVLSEIRSHFTAYWEPKGLYEGRKVEQLVRYAMELDRLDFVRQEKMHDTLADVAKRHPHLVTNAQRTAEAELRASISGGGFELLDLRVRRINSEISRLERDLLRLKKYYATSGPTDMLLKTQDGSIQSTNMNQRPFIENPTGEIPPSVPQPASVNAWAKAWAAKDVDRYLSYYAADFKVPGGESRADWEKGRRQRILAPKSISVGIEGLKVNVEGDSQASATFRQNYRSDVLKATSTMKTLVLVRADGRWKIRQERVGN